MCAVSGVLVLSLPIPIIAGNFEAFHKNQQKMTKAEKGKKKLKAAKIEEMETRQLYCNNKMTSCPSTRSPGKYLLISTYQNCCWDHPAKHTVAVLKRPHAGRATHPLKKGLDEKINT